MRPQRFLWAALALGSLLSSAVCYQTATQSIFLGSREGRWTYGYIQPFTAKTLAVSLLAVAFSCAMVWAQPGIRTRRHWRSIGAWLLVGLGLQALVRSLTPFSFGEIFASDGANAFYGVTGRYFASTVLGQFDTVRADWPLHAQSNMPGKLMLVYALRTVSKRPDVLAWLVVAVSNLGGILMYLFVRDLFKDQRTALFSLVLYLFVPGKLLFFPLLNTVTPVAVLAVACLVLRSLRAGGAMSAVLLGVALYGLVFYEPLPLVMGLLFALLAARALWRADLSGRQLFGHCGLALASFFATHAAFYLWWGFDLFGALRQVGAHAVDFNAAAQRPYSIWVRENLREFLFGIGACQAVLFGAALAEGLGQRGLEDRRLTRPIVVLCVGLLGILTATDLIGVNRGEVVRLWIFLQCFFQIPTAYVCARLEDRWAMALVLATTLWQGALGTAMIGFILPG